MVQTVSQIPLWESLMFYFGCIPEAGGGHRYWKFSNGHRIGWLDGVPGPWGDSIDSTKISPAYGRQGDAYMHYKDGWTALAIVDRTGDSRPGSRSVFITEGHLSFDAMLMLIVDECDLLSRIGEPRLK